MAGSKPQDVGDADPARVVDGPLPDVPSIHAAEEALAATLSEVDRTEAELRAAEEVLARLQAELAGRLSEAERLTTLVAQAYELQRQRLERELQQIQARARQLQLAREPKPVEDLAASDAAPPAPPAAPAPPPAPAQPPGEPTATPVPVEPAPAPAPVEPAPAPAPAAAAEGKAPRGKAAKNAEPAEGGEAYEDHWYQVLKQSGLGEEEPSDAAAGR